jgi:Rieske Fe-S protein
MNMNAPTPSNGRRKFITLVAGLFSALFVGETALAAKKPVAKKVVKKPVKKAPVKKAPAKPVAKSTPKATPTPTTAPSPSPTPTASATPTPTPTASATPTPTPTATPVPVPSNASALTVSGKNLTTADLSVGATTQATFLKSGRSTTVLVTRLDESTFIALKPVCTHAGGPVEISGGSLVCLWHNSRFNQRTGAVINGPAGESLPRENVALYGDTAYIIS